jgi:hypothetical protein
MNTQFIERMHTETARLLDARNLLAGAEADLAVSRLRLAEAERTLDELLIRLQADAPETCRNEVQRKAWAIAGSAQAAADLAALRDAHLAREIDHIRRRSGLRMAEDRRRFLETALAAAGLPDDLAVAALPETMPL